MFAGTRFVYHKSRYQGGEAGAVERSMESWVNIYRSDNLFAAEDETI